MKRPTATESWAVNHRSSFQATVEDVRQREINKLLQALGLGTLRRSTDTVKPPQHYLAR